MITFKKITSTIGKLLGIVLTVTLSVNFALFSAKYVYHFWLGIGQYFSS